MGVHLNSITFNSHTLRDFAQRKRYVNSQILIDSENQSLPDEGFEP